MTSERMKSEILAISSTPSSYPQSFAEAAQRWTQAIANYFSDMIVPPVAPSAPAAGIAAVTPLLATGFAGGNGIRALEQAFDLFAAILAANAVGGVAVPPVGLTFPPLPPTFNPNTPAEAMANTVFAWSLRGTFTVSPAPPVPWS